MSLTPTHRHGHTFLRDLAVQAAAHPKIEAAVLGALRAELPGVIEGLLRDAYGGETLRMYVAKGASRDTKSERDRRIVALGSPPSSMSTAEIAAREGISLRRVQQVLRVAGLMTRNSPP